MIPFSYGGLNPRLRETATLIGNSDLRLFLSLAWCARAHAVLSIYDASRDFERGNFDLLRKRARQFLICKLAVTDRYTDARNG